MEWLWCSWRLWCVCCGFVPAHSPSSVNNTRSIQSDQMKTSDKENASTPCCSIPDPQILHECTRGHACEEVVIEVYLSLYQLTSAWWMKWLGVCVSTYVCDDAHRGRISVYSPLNRSVPGSRPLSASTLSFYANAAVYCPERVILLFGPALTDHSLTASVCMCALCACVCLCRLYQT